MRGTSFTFFCVKSWPFSFPLNSSDFPTDNGCHPFYISSSEFWGLVFCLTGLFVFLDTALIVMALRKSVVASFHQIFFRILLLLVFVSL